MAKIVAEIGCNHRGSMDTAREMVRVAADAGADFVKFQKRNNRELLTEEEYNRPHPVPCNAYGPTYGAHREYLEFDLQQHKEMKTLCSSLGIGYSCSVWDVTSACEIMALKPEHIKIPSALNYNLDLYEAILDSNYRGDVHVSLGMTTSEEERQIVAYFTHRGALPRLVLYHCTSAYPAAFSTLCLRTIERLREDYPAVSVGYSGHHVGIAADVVALAFGAQWIERHFTLDKTWKGTDHAASLEPSELAQLVKDVRNVAKSLRIKNGNGLLQAELYQRKKLKKIQAVDGELISR